MLYLLVNWERYPKLCNSPYQGSSPRKFFLMYPLLEAILECGYLQAAHQLFSLHGIYQLPLCLNKNTEWYMQYFH